MVAPFSYKSWGPPQFLFNLNGTVGLNGANLIEDVQFIQFALKIVAKRSPFPVLNAEIKKFSVGEPCNGKDNDKLVCAIREYQKCRTGLIVDGKVNVIPANSNHKLYTLFSLNIDMVASADVDYPRVDRASGCPAAVKKAVKNIFSDVSPD